MQTKLTKEQALMRMEAACARAEHSSGEVRDKLRRLGINTDDADEIIESLEKRRFVDDERFARAFVHDKVRFARWGRLKIRMELVRKRVARDIIAAVLDEIDPEEYAESLRHILARKSAGMADADTREGRVKLMRYAASRGFEPSLIADVMRSDF